MLPSSGGRSHSLEIYTDRLRIEGTSALPYNRVTDILNTADREFLALDGATVAPLLNPAQASGPNRTTTLLRRLEARYVATTHDRGAPRPVTGEFAHIHKTPVACYGFLGPFVFHAQLHMRPGAALQDIMEAGGQVFIPLTNATVRLIERPDVPARQHAVIIVNRGFLDMIYLA
jgi:hypothetical protein